LSIIQGDIAQVVEIWELRVESQKSIESKYSEVYERQCLLLKSLISLTRDDFKKLFSEPKIAKNLLVQFSRARQDESIALLKFQNFEIFFVYTVIFPKIAVALPDLF
jgi:hypothetical protein